MWSPSPTFLFRCLFLVCPFSGLDNWDECWRNVESPRAWLLSTPFILDVQESQQLDIGYVSRDWAKRSLEPCVFKKRNIHSMPKGRCSIRSTSMEGKKVHKRVSGGKLCKSRWGGMFPLRQVGSLTLFGTGVTLVNSGSLGSDTPIGSLEGYSYIEPHLYDYIIFCRQKKKAYVIIIFNNNSI